MDNDTAVCTSNWLDIFVNNMENDPKQYTNLALNPDYQDVVAEFQEKLKSIKGKYF